MIKLSTILYPFALFIIMLALHILIWRIRKPKREIISLFLIFIIIPDLLMLGCLCVFPIIKIDPIAIEDLLLTLLLYTALAGAYIQTYPSMQAGSPSLLIVYLIGRNKKPTDEAEIQKGIQEENFINDRLSDLEAEKLIQYRNSDDFITITKKGSILSNIFILYRKFIGLKEGEG